MLARENVFQIASKIEMRFVDEVALKSSGNFHEFTAFESFLLFLVSTYFSLLFLLFFFCCFFFKFFLETFTLFHNTIFHVSLSFHSKSLFQLEIKQSNGSNLTFDFNFNYFPKN